MGWNDGLERKRFMARQKKQAEEYRKLGMTEEQIQSMYEFDLEQFRSDRRYYSHTQELTSSEFDDEDDEEDDSKSALLKKYTARMTSTIEAMTGDDPSWWIEDIDRQEFAKYLKTLTAKDEMILRMIFLEKLTHKEVAEKLGCTRQNITYRVSKFRKYVNNL